jgi:hypothetical protein
MDNATQEPKVARWSVVSWHQGNVGGESLVLNVHGAEFSICTGPTPWGTGSWGMFPISCIANVRPVRLSDRWAYGGAPHEKWGIEDLLRSFRGVPMHLYNRDAIEPLTALIASRKDGT